MLVLALYLVDYCDAYMIDLEFCRISDHNVGNYVFAATGAQY